MFTFFFRLLSCYPVWCVKWSHLLAVSSKMGIAVRHTWIISNIQFWERQDARNQVIHHHHHTRSQIHIIRRHGTPIDIIYLYNSHARIHVRTTNVFVVYHVNCTKMFPYGWCYGVAINILFYLILIFRMLLSVKPFVSMRCDGEHSSNRARARARVRTKTKTKTRAESEWVTNFNFNI